MNMKQHLPAGASCELRSIRTQSREARFEGNRFERIESADRLSETLRYLHQGRLSTVSSSRPSSQEDMLRQAQKMVPYGSPHTVEFVAEAEVRDLDLHCSDTLDSKQMIEMMGDFLSELRGLDSRLNVSTGINGSVYDVSLQTSNGFDHSYRKSSWSCMGGVELVQGDDLLMIYRSQSAITPVLDLVKMKNEIAEILEYAKTVVDFNPGAYPVIFAPQEVGNIINPVVQSLNGLAVARGLSPWKDKLGQDLLDTRFNLVDDGSLPGGEASEPFDGEGTPTRRNLLVDQGRPTQLLLDRKTAALLGKESSGNAGGRGTPQAHHLQLGTGSKSLQELISSIDYGLLIYDTMGAWSGNPYAGVVSGTVSLGLKIEKGQIIGRVKDCMFTINAFEHFARHLLDCSDKAEAIFGNLFPHVMLDEVVISTK